MNRDEAIVFLGLFNGCGRSIICAIIISVKWASQHTEKPVLSQYRIQSMISFKLILSKMNLTLFIKHLIFFLHVIILSKVLSLKTWNHFHFYLVVFHDGEHSREG